jgi:hypothetical protein
LRTLAKREDSINIDALRIIVIQRLAV